MNIFDLVFRWVLANEDKTGEISEFLGLNLVFHYQSAIFVKKFH